MQSHLQRVAVVRSDIRVTECPYAQLPGGSVSKADRGFASMPKHQVRAIAVKGGRAVHAQGRGYKWTKATAQAAGRLGGLKSQENRRQREALCRVASRLASGIPYED